MLTENDLRTLCSTACKAAIAAGEYIQSQFDQQNETMHKAGGNSLASQVVTAVDFKAQEIILQALESSTAQYDLGLLTEESLDDKSRHKKEYFWCIDPMDGTLAFTEGQTGYAVSIALVTHSGDPVIGVVYVPDLADCYTSIKGEGVRLNDEPFLYNQAISNDSLHVYMDKSLHSEPYFDSLIKKLNEHAHKMRTEIQYHVGFGAVRNAVGVMNSKTACYFKFAKKRTGGGSIWDYAATRLFFEELGLSVSDIAGKALHLNKPNTFMHEAGILYTTDPALSAYLINLGKQLSSH
jgi:3'(2'), 5'-bisphosphate nucleotidase